MFRNAFRFIKKKIKETNETFDRDGKFSQQIGVFKTFEETRAEMLKEQKNFSDKEETLGITEIIYDENGEELMNATCDMQSNQHQHKGE